MAVLEEGIKIIYFMKFFRIYFFIPSLFFLNIGFSQNDTLSLLFENSFKVFELLRNDQGIYRDSKVFNGTDFHPSSVASIGMGLISLCIADAMGWIDDAEAKAVKTLERIAGNHPTFFPDRNSSGFFRHWIDMDTGTRAWNSEYSTIDTGILICGALFCKKYFCNSEAIKEYADQLWDSVDWSKAIQDPQTGGIYLEMQADGSGKSGSVTLPFNEYMIVAWLAKNQEGAQVGPAMELWNNHYADPANLRTKNYQGIPVLTDNVNNFLSSFVIQFPYYLCHYFHTNPTYLDYMDQARRADSLWWANQVVPAEYFWGLGAGSYNEGSGYHADAINNNTSKVYSPHIIAGFLPIHPDGTKDLLSLYRNAQGLYHLPISGNRLILWRKSLTEADWNANEVQGVDYATMLFGLASLPEFLGKDFFKEHINFFEGPCGTLTDLENKVQPVWLELSPNPAIDQMLLKLNNPYRGKILLKILNGTGQLMRVLDLQKTNDLMELKLDVDKLETGSYYLEISGKDFSLSRFFIVLN